MRMQAEKDRDMGTATRSVLVTGGAIRIGREICLRLAQDGWHVLIHHRNSGPEAEATVGRIRRSGGVADALEADLVSLVEIERLVDAAVTSARERGSRLCGLVNNASLFTYDTLATMTPANWEQHLAVNLRAPIFLTRRFASSAGPEGGCVVNILDNKVNAPNPDYFSYTISKLGLASATATLALALAPTLRVCGVAPGITLPSERLTEEEFEQVHRANPLRRGCTTAQIAEAVRFIFESPSLTGQIIVIDGGQSLVNPGRDLAFLAL